MLYYDLKKTILNKKSVVLIVILLLFQSMLFFTWSSSSNIIDKDYKVIQEQIRGKEVEDALRFVEEDLSKYDYLMSDEPMIFDQEGFFDRSTLLRVQQELQHLQGYHTYYQSIVDPLKSNSEISVFKNKNPFLKDREKRIRNHYLNKDLSAGNSSRGTYGMEQVFTGSVK